MQCVLPLNLGTRTIPTHATEDGSLWWSPVQSSGHDDGGEALNSPQLGDGPPFHSWCMPGDRSDGRTPNGFADWPRTQSFGWIHIRSIAALNGSNLTESLSEVGKGTRAHRLDGDRSSDSSDKRRSRLPPSIGVELGQQQFSALHSIGYRNPSLSKPWCSGKLPCVSLSAFS